MEYQNENFGGEYEFRCRFHDGWVMQSHLHAYSELLYCQKGNCRVTVNGSTMTLSEKHFLWLMPNTIHQFHPTDAQLVCAVFSGDYIPAFFRALGQRRLKIAPMEAGELGTCLEQLPKVDPEDSVRISGFLNLIGARVLESADYESARATDGVLYQKVITYLSDHFREEISLKSVARHFGYNEKYLSHALHSLTGIPFGKLIAFYRVEYAKKRLRSGEDTVARVAAESGFSALNSFNRVFKEMTGVTPSQYRKASLG